MIVERKYNQKRGDGGVLPIISQRKRFWELDFLRGLCVLLMVMYHFFYAASSFLYTIQEWAGVQFWSGLESFADLFLVNRFIETAHYVAVSVFLLLCGISCTLSHNNTLRGAKTLGAALVITMVTWLADEFIMSGVQILFGVIHMLACAMLLYSLLDALGRLFQFLLETPRTKTLALWVRRLTPMTVGIIGLILFFTIPLGHFGTASAQVTVDGKGVIFYFPRLFSDVSKTDSRGLNNLLAMLLPLNNYSLSSADYFPIFPYAFVVLVGSGIGHLVYHTRAKNALAPLDGRWNKPVSFVGRHALLVYLFHQVVIVAVLFAVGGVYSLLN